MKNLPLMVMLFLGSNVFAQTYQPPRNKTFVIKLEEVEISFSSTDIWSTDSIFSLVDKDTVIVVLGLGEDLQQKVFTLITNNNDSLDAKVYESYKTTLSVLDDGAHLDLEDWRHFESEKVDLELSNGQFKTKEITEKEWGQFPTFREGELLKEVIRVTGGTENKWYRKGPNGTTPYAVSISERVLSVSLKDKKGITCKNTIIFKYPMAC